MTRAPATLAAKRQAQPDCNSNLSGSYTSRIDSIISALLAGGIEPKHPGNVFGNIQNGRLLRFATRSKPKKTNGWMVVHFNQGLPFLAVAGDWATGAEVKWVADNREGQSPLERHQTHARLQEIIEAQRIGQAKRWQQAALSAARVWGNCEPADPNHPYLQRKGVQPLSARQQGDRLVLLLTDLQWDAWSLQTISATGDKRLMAGGRKSGCCIYVHGPIQPSQVLICEGFATGATLAEQHTKALVLAAVDAGNLKGVAIAVREKWPNAELVICGDDDRQTPGNPGASAARAAAVSASAYLAFPEWPEVAPKHLTDFNDLENWWRGVYETGK